MKYRVTYNYVVKYIIVFDRTSTDKIVYCVVPYFNKNIENDYYHIDLHVSCQPDLETYVSQLCRLYATCLLSYRF